MATINDKKMIDDIIANNGYYEGDHNEPCAVKIVEYTNAWGKVTWGVVWDNEHPSRWNRYLKASEYVQNPKVIWELPDA